MRYVDLHMIQDTKLLLNFTARQSLGLDIYKNSGLVKIFPFEVHLQTFNKKYRENKHI